MNSHVHFLKHCDVVVVVRHGQVFSGTYKDMAKAYPRLLKPHVAAAVVAPVPEAAVAPGSPTLPAGRARTSSASFSAAVSHMSGSRDGSVVAKEQEVEEETETGVLVKAEERAKGHIAGFVWRRYFSSATAPRRPLSRHPAFAAPGDARLAVCKGCACLGPALGIALLVLVVVVFGPTQAARIGGDVWVSDVWADRKIPGWSELDYFYGYATLVAMTFVLVLCRSLLFTTVNVRASSELHQQLLVSLVRAPANLFHDMVPLGRITNRFSADLDEVQILCLFISFLSCPFASLHPIAPFSYDSYCL
jgi:hypothetical protein